MKRVFHIITHFDVGGAERVAMNIARSQTPDYEYHVVEVVRAHGAFTKQMIAELEQAGISYHRSPFPEFHFHFMAERLAACLFPLRFLWLWWRYRPQVVHSHTEVPDLATWLTFHCLPWLRKSCQVVRTIHNTQLWTGLKRTGQRVERFFQSQQANVAISASVQQCYEDAYGEQPPIIYNGVSPVRQQPYPKLVAGKVNILFAGRFEPQKGIATLIDIIREADVAKYHFHLVGDGTLRPLIESRLRGLPHVSVRQAVYGLSSYLASFDYLLMPSVFEGLSILSIEAAMNHLPVIANDCLGLHDTLPPDWALTVHDNSQDDYRRLFREVLPTCSRTELTAQAHAFAQAHFSLEQMQRSYEQVYG